jgi:hypothetical protein
VHRNRRRSVVFNGVDMQLHRRLIAAAVPALTVLASAAPAQARIIEVGQASTQATPTCPSSPCLAVSRTTGYQVKVGDKRNLYTIPADGKIVAWTISLGNPTAKQVDFFNQGYGQAQAAITVIKRRMWPRGTGAWRVVAESPLRKLKYYFGQTVQFPLDTSLAVKKGMVIALTVPTWAPALTTLLSDGSYWRASRPKNACDDTETQTAFTTVGSLPEFRCPYKARLAYTATLVTRPQPTTTSTTTK